LSSIIAGVRLWKEFPAIASAKDLVLKVKEGWERRSQRLSYAKCVVFISHVIKTKNRNRSMNKLKNLGYDR